MRKGIVLATGLACFIAIVAACVGDDPAGQPTAGDAGDEKAIEPDTGVDAGVDAPIDAIDATPPPCNLAEPFGAPVLLAGASNEEAEQTARLANAGLHLYLSRPYPDGGFEDLFRAERTTTATPFAAAVPLFAPLDGGSRSAPTVTADGKTLYYVSLDGDGGAAVHVSERQSSLQVFTPGGPWNVSGSGPRELAPYVVPDGSAIYYVTSIAGGQYRIYRVKNGASGLGAPEIQFDPPSSPTALTAPVVTADGLRLYVALRFAASTSIDIYEARRNSKGDLFGTPQPIAPINDPVANDYPSYVTDDGCALILTSTRSGGPGGGGDIWEARRPK